MNLTVCGQNVLCTFENGWCGVKVSRSWVYNLNCMRRSYCGIMCACMIHVWLMASSAFSPLIGFLVPTNYAVQINWLNDQQMCNLALLYEHVMCWNLPFHHQNEIKRVYQCLTMIDWFVWEIRLVCFIQFAHMVSHLSHLIFCHLHHLMSFHSESVLS